MPVSSTIPMYFTTNSTGSTGGLHEIKIAVHCFRPLIGTRGMPTTHHKGYLFDNWLKEQRYDQRYLLKDKENPTKTAQGVFCTWTLHSRHLICDLLLQAKPCNLIIFWCIPHNIILRPNFGRDLSRLKWWKTRHRNGDRLIRTTRRPRQLFAFPCLLCLEIKG